MLVEAATFSAIAAGCAAVASWYAHVTATRREIGTWKRDTVLKSAIAVIQQGQRRHNIEHHYFDRDEISRKDLLKVQDELRRLTEDVESNNQTVRILGSKQLIAAVQRAVDVHYIIDFDIEHFVSKSPGGGKYPGRMYCLQSIDGGDVTAGIEHALRLYTQTSFQQFRRRGIAKARDMARVVPRRRHRTAGQAKTAEAI